MTGQASIVMKRDLKRVRIEHALEGARKHGFEVLGWLTGFSTEDTVYICDVAPCPGYKVQNRYSAEADPSEEAKLASRFPRNVGIIGLYHSHPFKMDHESAEFRKIHGTSELFHSGVDNAMLQSRSSAMKNYVSIVTDIDSISCYVMHHGKPKQIKENLVDNINFSDHMRPINTKVQLTIEESFDKKQSLSIMIREIEEKLIVDMSSELKEDSAEIQQGPVGNVMRILSLEQNPRGAMGGSKGNFFCIGPEENNIKIKAVMNLTPTIYVQKGYIDLSSAVESMKNEIADYIIYLTWNDVNYPEFEKHLSSNISELEVHLGRITTKYNDKSGMPQKTYTKPKRRMMLRKK